MGSNNGSESASSSLEESLTGKKEEVFMEKEESKQEVLVEKKEDHPTKEALSEDEKAIREKEEQEREERRAAACAKAAEREARVAKKREELLEAKKEKARKQQERVARQQELKRARDQGCCDLEAVLSSVESELAISIASRGTESDHSIALVEKAETIRQQIKAHKDKKAQADKAAAAAIFSRKSLLPAADGQAQTTDGWQADMAAAAAAVPVLSAEEQELIDEHRKGRLIASQQASDWN